MKMMNLEVKISNLCLNLITSLFLNSKIETHQYVVMNDILLVLKLTCVSLICADPTTVSLEDVIIGSNVYLKPITSVLSDQSTSSKSHVDGLRSSQS